MKLFSPMKLTSVERGVVVVFRARELKKKKKERRRRGNKLWNEHASTVLPFFIRLVPVKSVKCDPAFHTLPLFTIATPIVER